MHEIMIWKGPKVKLRFVACSTLCTLVLLLVVFNKNYSRPLRPKHRPPHKRKVWKMVPGYNQTAAVQSSEFPVIPSWIPKLSRAIKESTPIPVSKLEAMFSDAQFYSSPAVDFNSTVIQSILTELEMDNFDPEVKVPNIVHLVWFYYPKRQIFRFHQVICMLSIRKFIKPDKILFWYDMEPSGRWWHYIKGLLSNILLMVQRRAPNKIFQHRIRVPEHKADIARLEAVIAFGGKNSFQLLVYHAWADSAFVR